MIMGTEARSPHHQSVLIGSAGGNRYFVVRKLQVGHDYEQRWRQDSRIHHERHPDLSQGGPQLGRGIRIVGGKASGPSP